MPRLPSMSGRPCVLTRLMRPIVQLRDGEAGTALLMFLYSFMAMTSYNIAKPIRPIGRIKGLSPT